MPQQKQFGFFNKKFLGIKEELAREVVELKQKKKKRKKEKVSKAYKPTPKYGL